MFTEPACTKTHYRITRQDLPLSCPMPGMTLWSAHPKVYLAIEETGQAMCEYCGAHYKLTDSESTNAAEKRD